MFADAHPGGRRLIEQVSQVDERSRAPAGSLLPTLTRSLPPTYLHSFACSAVPIPADQYAGTDATEVFFELHRADVLTKPGREKLIVGRLEGQAPMVPVDPGDLSAVPFSEMPAFSGISSPYFTDSHEAVRRAVRQFVERELTPIAAAADASGEYPDRQLRRKLGMSGMYVTRLGPGPWMAYVKNLGISIPGDLEPEDFSYFHEMVVTQASTLSPVVYTQSSPCMHMLDDDCFLFNISARLFRLRADTLPRAQSRFPCFET